MAERVPTQFLPLDSHDFGPEQEEAGSRIRGLARPPPTETIKTHVETVRSSADVLSELGTTQSILSVRSRRFTKTALSIWVAALDSARRIADEARARAASVQRSDDATSGRSTRARRSEVLVTKYAVPLSVLPGPGATIARSLAAGTEVVTYLEIEAPPGWIAVRAPTGELGYLPIDILTKG